MINKLSKIIEERLAEPHEGSYTNMLFDSGIERISQKVGEEAVELVIASNVQSRERIIEESADLIYHMMVLLTYNDITLSEVEIELEKRHQK